MGMCRKGIHGHYPDAKYTQCPECAKLYKKAYNQRPDRKAYEKARNQTAKRKECNRRADKKRKNDPERIAYIQALSKTSKQKTKDKVRHSKRTRIAARGDLTTRQLEDRLQEFDRKCAYCNVELTFEYRYDSTHYTIEHIIPLLKDGQHTKSNVVPACRSCNSSKKNKDVRVWMCEKNYIPSEKLAAILDNLFSIVTF